MMIFPKCFRYFTNTQAASQLDDPDEVLQEFSQLMSNCIKEKFATLLIPDVVFWPVSDILLTVMLLADSSWFNSVTTAIITNIFVRK